MNIITWIIIALLAAYVVVAVMSWTWKRNDRMYIAAMTIITMLLSIVHVVELYIHNSAMSTLLALWWAMWSFQFYLMYETAKRPDTP